jgi:hypothetical protein
MFTSSLHFFYNTFLNFLPSTLVIGVGRDKLLWAFSGLWRSKWQGVGVRFSQIPFVGRSSHHVPLSKGWFVGFTAQLLRSGFSIPSPVKQFLFVYIIRYPTFLLLWARHLALCRLRCGVFRYTYISRLLYPLSACLLCSRRTFLKSGDNMVRVETSTSRTR